MRVKNISGRDLSIASRIRIPAASDAELDEDAAAHPMLKIWLDVGWLEAEKPKRGRPRKEAENAGSESDG